MKASPFLKQAELVLRLLPFIYFEKNLALKGGTAINFFERNLPRLSVDIDLTYVPVTGRHKALKNITSILNSVSERANKQIPGMFIKPKRLKDGTIPALLVQNEAVQIKVEVNLVIRGVLHPLQVMNICPNGRNIFQIAPKARILSFSELFGGKLCAALDRQHPRDLFDIKLLLEHEGLTEKTRKAFIVYLISHPRPMVELLDPHLKDIQPIFENEFKGMTNEPVTLQELIEVRERLIRQIHEDLTSEERCFILSIKKRNPDWGLLGIQGVGQLPAVKWKLENLKHMNGKKHSEAIDKLKKCLRL